MMLIGMAVGVDYSLFYLKREREERARGAGKLAALEAAAATSGHAVLVSGITVMASLAGMFFMGDAEGGAMAIGSILVVGVAVLGSLTVLPAVLAKLGDRVHKSRLPLLRRLRREERDSRVWGFVLGHVHAPPASSRSSPASRVLAALALPALGMHTKSDRHRTTSPRDAFPVLKTLRPHRRRPSRPRSRAPMVVIQADDVTRPAVQAAIAELRAPGARRPAGRHRSTTTELSRDGTVAHRRPAARRRRLGRESQAALDAARAASSRRRSARSPAPPSTSAATPPRPRTRNDNLSAHAPLVFGFVLTMAFLLLLVTFRSIVIPIKAILLNLLSVAAAFGVLTLVFQHGLGEVIGMPHTDGHRLLAAGVPVRDPVRPLDGLPRVHPEPDQGGLGQGPRQRRPPSSRASAARPASSPPPRR